MRGKDERRKGGKERGREFRRVGIRGRQVCCLFLAYVCCHTPLSDSLEARVNGSSMNMIASHRIEQDRRGKRETGLLSIPAVVNHNNSQQI